MLPAVEPASAASSEKLYCIPKGTSKLIEYTGGGNPTDIGVSSVANAYLANTAAVIDGQPRRIDTTNCTNAGGSGSLMKDTKNIATNDGYGYSGIGYSPNGKTNTAPLIALDNDGRLHFVTVFAGSGSTGLPSGSSSSLNYLVDARNAETYRFSAIAYDFQESEYGGTLLLGHRVTDTQGATVINQMPTTGAPEGLSMIGLLAIGVGLVGVTLVLARRRV